MKSNQYFISIIFIFLYGCSTFGPEPVYQVELLPGHTRSQHEAYAKKAMVSTQGEASTRAGIKMLQQGGNAIDAAVAVSFALSVERPQSTGIGGGGFMLVHGPNLPEPIAIDFREVAPSRAHRKMFLDPMGNELQRRSVDGVMAGAVPGLVAGLLEVHKLYGKLKLKDVMQPAIDLAKWGFPVYPHLAKAIAYRKDVLEKYPASKKIFFRRDGKPLEQGDLLVQRDLAKTLIAIANEGKKGFYMGWVAKAFVSEQLRLGGLIRHDDLENYVVKFRKPAYGSFKGHDVYSMGPPSSGGVHIIQILNTLEPLNLSGYGFQSPQSVHLISSAFQQAFADRAKYLGDSDFVNVPVEGLTSKEYADEIRKNLSLTQARKLASVEAGQPFAYESDETTHFTLADGEGYVVSSTQTINGWMGSGVIVPGTGILLNNEMDDFATKVGSSNMFGAVGGNNNLIEPYKRPLSSMSPTIVVKDGKFKLALGTPSGTRILTCVAQTLLNYLEFERPLFESIAATRFHHQWSPDEIRIGDPGFSSSTLGHLKKLGHTLNYKNLGCKVQAVAMENGLLHGVSDPRGEGLSLGL